MNEEILNQKHRGSPACEASPERRHKMWMTFISTAEIIFLFFEDMTRSIFSLNFFGAGVCPEDFDLKPLAGFFYFSSYFSSHVQDRPVQILLYLS